MESNSSVMITLADTTCKTTTEYSKEERGNDHYKASIKVKDIDACQTHNVSHSYS